MKFLGNKSSFVSCYCTINVLEPPWIFLVCFLLGSPSLAYSWSHQTDGLYRFHTSISSRWEIAALLTKLFLEPPKYLNSKWVSLCSYNEVGCRLSNSLFLHSRIGHTTDSEHFGPHVTYVILFHKLGSMGLSLMGPKSLKFKAHYWLFIISLIN